MTRIYTVATTNKLVTHAGGSQNEITVYISSSKLKIKPIIPECTVLCKVASKHHAAILRANWPATGFGRNFGTCCWLANQLTHCWPCIITFICSCPMVECSPS